MPLPSLVDHPPCLPRTVWRPQQLTECPIKARDRESELGEGGCRWGRAAAKEECRWDGGGRAWKKRGRKKILGKDRWKSVKNYPLPSIPWESPSIGAEGSLDGTLNEPHLVELTQRWHAHLSTQTIGAPTELLEILASWDLPLPRRYIAARTCAKLNSLENRRTWPGMKANKHPELSPPLKGSGVLRLVTASHPQEQAVDAQGPLATIHCH